MSATERPRVLIVDDDRTMRHLLAAILTQEYECVSASSAAEARDQLGEINFELVLCDVNMSGESGLELARHVLTAHPEMATLMVSGIDDADVARIAVDYGAYGYLIKPFKDNELLIAASNALRRRALEITAKSTKEQLENLVRARTAELEQALKRVEAVAVEIRRSRGETIERLARAVEYRDPETAGHIDRMSRYCGRLADTLALHSDTIRVAAPMHDVGKVGLPDHILLKPEPLTSSERQQMQSHCEIGHGILTGSGSSLLELAATIALTHHEKHDGTGYPRGLAGDEIPLEARVVAIADVFDALTTDRSYRPAFELDDAVQCIRTQRGKHFDPVVVDAFLDDLPAMIRIRERFADSTQATGDEVTPISEPPAAIPGARP